MSFPVFIAIVSAMFTTSLAPSSAFAQAETSHTQPVRERANKPDVKTTIHRIESKDVTLTVREMGEGEPVVFLTGGPGFAGRQLLPTTQHIVEHYRVILPDQRGTGGSVVDPFDASDFTFESAINDLEAIRNSLEIDRWTLVGHSWGSLLAMAYSAEHPERVARMALISPAGIDSSFWATYQANLIQALDGETRAALGTLRPNGESLDDIAEYARETNRLMAPGMIANPDENQAILEALREEMTPARMNPKVSLAMQQELANYDLKPKLASFTAPTLIIKGDKDPVGQLVSDQITKTIKSARIKVIPNCGHWPFLERPDHLNALLASFLKSKPKTLAPAG